MGWPMSSDTPRTNRALQLSDGQWSFVLRDTARELERELNAANERITTLTGLFGILAQIIKKAESTNHEQPYSKDLNFTATRTSNESGVL